MVESAYTGHPKWLKESIKIQAQVLSITTVGILTRKVLASTAIGVKEKKITLDVISWTTTKTLNCNVLLLNHFQLISLKSGFEIASYFGVWIVSLQVSAIVLMQTETTMHLVRKRSLQELIHRYREIPTIISIWVTHNALAKIFN